MKKLFVLTTALILASLCQLFASTTVYFYNDQNWSTVKVYWWGGNNGPLSYPGYTFIDNGNAVSSVKNGNTEVGTCTTETFNRITVFKITIYDNATGLIINNNGSTSSTGKAGGGNLNASDTYFTSSGKITKAELEAIGSSQGGQETTTYHDLYLVGEKYGNWNTDANYKFSRQEGSNVYTITVPKLEGKWKIWDGSTQPKSDGGTEWDYNFGPGSSQPVVGTEYNDIWFKSKGGDFTTTTTKETTIKFTLVNGSDVKDSTIPSKLLITEKENGTVVDPPVTTYHDLYLVGANYDNWGNDSDSPKEKYKMTRNGNVYTYTTESGLSGAWKIWDGQKDSNGNWTYSFGAGSTQPSEGKVGEAWFKSNTDFTASTSKKTTITLTLVSGSDVQNSSIASTILIKEESGIVVNPPSSDDTYSFKLLGTIVNGKGWSDPIDMTDNSDGTYSLTADYQAGDFGIQGYKNGTRLSEGLGGWIIGADITAVGNYTVAGKGGSNTTDSKNSLSGKYTFTLTWDPEATSWNLNVKKYVEGPVDVPTATGMSGTLPVLYINVYDDEAHSSFNTDFLNKDYIDKVEHMNAEYYIEVPAGASACDWAQAIGSKEEPLALSVKLRGNYTRTGFSKKPFKLKLAAKANLLGLTEDGSKHYALLAHADDNYGFMRNFVGFELGKLIGLPWSPNQQPVEVVINGQYRGLYFLTESIRVEKKRVNIKELAETETDPKLCSGGYLIELDNYPEDQSIQYSTAEKYVDGRGHADDGLLRVTFNTPEVVSGTERTFLEDQFDTMNDLVSKCNNSNDLWSYMELDDAVRYYMVMEIIGHWEAYHGSTYMYRDFGNNQKWHFGPLWDCGNAFNKGAEDGYFYDGSTFGNTWISSMRTNAKFNQKVKDTWKWFIAKGYTELASRIDAYAALINEASKADAAYWSKQSQCSSNVQTYSSGLLDKAEIVKSYLSRRVANLSSREFGSAVAGADEPARDDTPAAALPDAYDPDSEVVEPPVPPTPEVEGRFIYVYDASNWNTSNNPLHAYIYVSGVTDVKKWPGFQLTYNAKLTYGDKTGLYYVEVPAEYDGKEISVIINTNGGSGRYPADNQPGMTVAADKSGYFDTSGQSMVALDAPLTESETPYDPVETPEGRYVYVKDAYNWSGNGSNTFSAYIYADGKGDNGTWPGANMHYGKNITYSGSTGLYYIQIPSKFDDAAVRVIISCGGNRYPGENVAGMEIAAGKSGIFTTGGNSITALDEALAGTPLGGKAVISGTLPVLYINVYNDDTYTSFNGDMLDKDYLLKTEHTFAKYYIEVPEGAKKYDWAAEMGSKEAPLDLSIKLRGNYTRTGFSKKPYKLKLGKKQNLLGLSSEKSKHYALLAHADDEHGFMRNFVGFELGKLIGLPWTPNQQPVEVVINGEYRGLYFLTESIRIEPGRIDITELAEGETDKTKCSGGYLVELDNYSEDSSLQYQTTEKTCVSGHAVDMLRVTYDTPEILSAEQKEFIKNQFDKMNELVGNCNTSNDLWAYMYLDDAVRYYMVMEIIGHWEAYHGSTYMYRDFGNDQKWHFSPLWDCGNAFAVGAESGFFYDNDTYGNTWIPSMRTNAKFNDKVKETWKWFIAKGYTELAARIDAYAAAIDVAARNDAAKWENAPKPNGGTDPVNNNSVNPSPVDVNYDVLSEAEWVKDYLKKRVTNLSSREFGSAVAGASEPARDTTPAAELPEEYKPLPPFVTSGKLPVLNITTQIGLAALNGTDKPKDKSATFAFTYADGTAHNFGKSNVVAIKGRGSDTFANFDKKPYKLEFDKKQQFTAFDSDIASSKHYLLMPYLAGEQENVMLKNILGYELARRAGLTWTPAATPVELVIDDTYLGLYYLTETIRPSVNRVPVGDYADLGDDTVDLTYSHDSEWLVEVCTDEDAADEAIYSWTDNGKTYYVKSENPDLEDVAKNITKGLDSADAVDVLKGHIAAHMKAICDAVDATAADQDNHHGWKEVIDMEQAARFFLVQEIMDDNRAFETGFYMWHSAHAADQTWKFGPVWDFQGAFCQGGNLQMLHGSSSESVFVNKLYKNAGFVVALIDRFEELTGRSIQQKTQRRAANSVADAPITGIGDYLQTEAAKLDAVRALEAETWKDYTPDSFAAQATDLTNSLNAKVDYLASTWSSYDIPTGIEGVGVEAESARNVEYFDVTGRRVAQPVKGQIIIVRQGNDVRRIAY